MACVGVGAVVGVVVAIVEWRWSCTIVVSAT